MKTRTTLAVMLIIFVATAAIYSRAAYFPFSAIDDHVYVTKNPYVTSGLSVESIKWAFTSFHGSNWHPVTWLSLMLDGQLFGRNPMGYHLHNVVLHALNAALLCLLLVSMTGALWRSAFVAACFALHPLHVESVAWIAERKDVLSGLFLMLTLLCYSAYVKQAKRRMYFLALAAFALGLMAKPMLVTLPVVLLLLDFWPLERFELPTFGSGKARRLKDLLLEKVPFLLFSAASALLTMYAQDRGAAVATLTQIPVSIRINNALWSTFAYLEKMFFPFDLAVYYPYALVPSWKAVCAALLLIIVLGMAARNMKRHGYLATGWCWYLVTLLPVIGLIQVGSQAMADRYTYIPYIGLFIMASWGGAELGSKLPIPDKALRLAAAGVLLFFAIVTWVQLGYWRDNERLIRHTLEITDKNYFAHFALGGFYEEQGKTDLAIAEYREVMRINPGAKHVHFKLGAALNKQGKLEEAISYLAEAIRRNPRNAEAHFTMGVVMEKLGRLDDAMSSYREALKIDPDYPIYHTNLGTVLARQGRLDEAIAHFSRALQLNPNDRRAAANLQLALRLKGGNQEGGK